MRAALVAQRFGAAFSPGRGPGDAGSESQVRRSGWNLLLRLRLCLYLFPYLLTYLCIYVCMYVCIYLFIYYLFIYLLFIRDGETEKQVPSRAPDLGL